MKNKIRIFNFERACLVCAAFTALLLSNVRAQVWIINQSTNTTSSAYFDNKGYSLYVGAGVNNVLWTISGSNTIVTNANRPDAVIGWALKGSLTNTRMLITNGATLLSSYVGLGDGDSSDTTVTVTDPGSRLVART